MRLPFLLAGSLLLAAGASAQAKAQATGAWRVDGAIAGRTFTLDCSFTGSGGVCVDAGSGGKRSHPLASLTADGDRIAWSFMTRVAIISVTLDFAGRIAGNRMSGTMRAAGRSGSFTAIRR